MDARCNHIAGSTVRMFALAALLGAAGSVSAQMYVWKDPETGTTKMSNLRPEWFRNPAMRGPHTQLLLNGRLVDDTRFPLNLDQSMLVAKKLEEAARQADEADLKQQQETEKAGLKAGSERPVESRAQKQQEAPGSEKNEKEAVLEAQRKKREEQLQVQKELETLPANQRQVFAPAK